MSVPSTPAPPPRAFGDFAASIVVIVLLTVAGIGHRVLVRQIGVALGQVLPLKQPLESIPLQLGDWEGVDLPVDERVQQIAGDDHFLNRQYQRKEDGRTVSLYVGYMGRTRSRFSHRPDICYSAHGFKQVSRTPVWAATANGEKIPLVLYEYRAPEAGGPTDLILATYLMNGQFVNSPDTAPEFNTRRASLFGRRPVTYLTRIQLALRATDNRSLDSAVLSGLATQVSTLVKARMPSEEVNSTPEHAPTP